MRSQRTRAGLGREIRLWDGFARPRLAVAAIYTRGSRREPRLLPHQRTLQRQLLNTERPGNVASAPRASSMRRSWLYFATRSERDGAPVLICPQPVATARSAIVTSSVSPDRCDITAV